MPIREIQDLSLELSFTPRTLVDHDLMPFSKYKGSQMQDVPAGFLLWLFEQPWLKSRYASVFNYIDELQSLLRAEVVEEKRERAARARLTAQMRDTENPEDAEPDYDKYAREGLAEGDVLF